MSARSSVESRPFLVQILALTALFLPGLQGEPWAGSRDRPVIITWGSVSETEPAGRWLLVGAVNRGKWLNAKKARRLVRGDERYRVYRLTDERGPFPSRRPAITRFVDHMVVRIATRGLAESDDYLATSRADSGHSRPVRLAAAIQMGEARRAARKLLGRRRIIADRLSVVAVRADIDGDGLEEIIASARAERKSDELWSHASTILLRPPRENGPPAELVIHEDLHDETNGDRWSDRLLQILDIDGDAVMEIVLAHLHFEDLRLQIYSLKGNKVIRVLEYQGGV